MTMFSETVRADGHLIDSQIMSSIFDTVIECGGEFEVIRFEIGRTNEDFSHLELQVKAPTQAGLRHILEELVPLGCHAVREKEVLLRPAEKKGCVPDDFYSTTNHRTWIFHQGQWREVASQRMDAVIVVQQGSAECRKLREVRAGDSIVCGVEGIRVVPEFKERDRSNFSFMSHEVSSERRVELMARRVADAMRQIKREKGRIGVVAGPVVVHTGGVRDFCDLIRRGYVDVLLSGNALAVHDVEFALLGTSLGIDLEKGNPVDEGHKHHMRAINAIQRAGGIRPAVEQGVLRSGIFYECVKNRVPYILAGSIRDDGPLPDTLMDLIEAQNQYAALLQGIRMVLMLSSMLHSIGVGNMLPSWVRVVCVDINPAVVTKLADRGSAQTVGIVTDVGLFLHVLAGELRT